MSFPLADWIMAHEGEVEHDLAQSGLKGQLRSVRPCLQSLRPGDPKELRERLAELLGAAPSQVVLTPGATTANSLIVLYLAGEVRRRVGRVVRARIRSPEYPPLRDIAEGAGYRVARGQDPVDLALLSHPNNPEGTRMSDRELFEHNDPAAHILVDETFREFTSAPSLARLGDRRTWVTGTFTKVYGADAVRLGYAVAPPSHARAFSDFAPLWVDRVSPFSVGGALALLDRRKEVLQEARSLFEGNLRALQRRLPEVPSLAAPVWFDRGFGPEGSEAFARRALRAGLLVCPGAYFRDPSGVRICLTARSFPRDLEAYLALGRKAAPRGRAERPG